MALTPAQIATFFNTGALPAGVVTNTQIAANAGIARTQLAQDPLQPEAINPALWRVWDDMGSNLPSAGANDDFGLVGGTFATASPVMQSKDFTSNGAVEHAYARILMSMPLEFDPLNDIRLRFHAWMGVVADISATLDMEAFLSDKEAGIGADLVSTSATSINSASKTDYDFVIDGSGLNPGDSLDIRINAAVRDNASGAGIVVNIGSVQRLVDIRG